MPGKSATIRQSFKKMTITSRPDPRASRLAAGVLAVSLALAISGCRRDEPPAARLVASSTSIRLGYPESVPLTLSWTALEPLRKPGMRPTVFVHLIDRPNHVLRTFDHDLPGEWKVGVTRKVEIDLFQSALGPPLPAGSYTLTAGLYDPALGYRWALATQGPDVTGHREYRVASLSALPGRSGDALFRFVGGWAGTERGADKQILHRRWLTGSGTLVVEPSPQARRIRIGTRIVSEEGAVRGGMTATCETTAREMAAGAGSFEAVPLPGQPCEIRWERLEAAPPPFTAPARWLALESLAVRSPPRPD
ncbi:MAG: hypothetical protein ABI592_01360 [Acidobacteriota bacterium]